jgi:hypothetical protein
MARLFNKRYVVIKGVLAMVLLISLPQHAFALSGSWSCLGSVVFGNTSAGNGFTTQLQEMMHLNLTAGAAPGNVIINNGGEACVLTISGLAITTNAAGQGTMKLTFNSSVADIDKDKPNCGALIWGRTGFITQNFLISTFNLSKAFYFIPSDDSISPSSADNSDFVEPSGQCSQQ